ncbi:hypothetical protein BX666DRAFT_2022035 [Dichotomocladium elegans]|nr:hypothetical protein BX666DRAFT_2022035 [Dichotomocladium elegans]
MLFSRAAHTNAVRSLNIAVIPSGEDRVVAFGPGSVVNGSIVLTLNRPIKAHGIRVVFRCEQFNGLSEQGSTLFKVIQQPSIELPGGSHMYLFAIKLPFVNYPPSIHGTYVGHRIVYSLQAFLDMVDDDNAPRCVESTRAPLLYLPFTTCTPLPGDTRPLHGAKKMQTFKRNHAVVEVAAEVIKPAYCPGDPCTIRFTTNNYSDCKISHMDVSLVCNISTLGDDGITRNTKHHTLQTETFYVAIPRDAKGHQSVFCFNMPDDLVPSMRHGKQLEVAYEVVITMPLSSSTLGNDSTGSILWPFTAFGGGGSSSSSSSGTTSQQQPFINTIALPVQIATVPAGFPIPDQLAMPLKTYNEQPDVPSFIPSIDSPLPSPSTPMFSPVGSWAGSPAPEFERLSPSNSIHDHQDLDDILLTSQQDASGHLMVPSSPLLDGTRFDSQARRKSTGSVTDGMGISVAVQ